MKCLLLLTIIIMLSTCAALNKDNKPRSLIIPHENEIRDQLSAYLYQGMDKADENGFVHGGDGMLFSCLRYAAGAPVNWKNSHVLDDNYWMVRKPGYVPSGEKWSYYSKDMMVGELICVWVDKDLDFLRYRIQWLENHNWDLCGGSDYAHPYGTWLSRCKISINLKDTIFEMRKRLGGKDNPATWVPQIWNPYDLKDFTSHLNALQILLRGVMMGGINDIQLKYLKNLSEEQNRNALYSAIYHLFSDKDMTIPISLLRDKSLFPVDILPTTENYCTDYLWQRDQNDDEDWKPCPDENKTHDGVDFCIAAKVILGEFGNM